MYPLTLHHLLWRMRTVHPLSEVVTVNGSAHDLKSESCTYEQLAWRVDALAYGFRDRLGLGTGDTVTVLGWNDQHHLELLLAVPLTGAKLNSINLRLGGETLSYLARTPRPKVVIVDTALFGHPAVGTTIQVLLEELRKDGIPIVAITPPGERATGSRTMVYETLVEDHLGRRWEETLQDENTTAFLFHTSGTTGRPKSYAVSHRAAVLHCLSQATVEATGLSSSDRVLPLAPFFHVNGWGLPLTTMLTGASLVLAGGDLSPVRIARIMQEERVTVAAAVPTVWFDVCAAIERGEAMRPSALREIFTGGSALPESVWRSIQTTLGVGVATAWGMTETMACSTYERERPCDRAGKPIPLVEIGVQGTDDSPTNSAAPPGRLQVRGPFIIGNQDAPNDWFVTGDIVTIDPYGALILRDRENDLIKSGGEWIAPAEIEQVLCTHPGVASAAVVAVSHPKWIERPRAFVVLTPQAGPCDSVQDELFSHLEKKFPRWWLPDQIVVVEELPTTGVGKLDKRALRNFAESQKEQVKQ